MISVAAYLENEKVADLRSEYINGHRVPLIEANRLHDQVCMRLAQILAEHLSGLSCRLYRPAVKVHVCIPGDERFYYPDLQVGCGEAAEHPDYLEAPKLILEVLSAVSERRDREEKAPAYRTIAALEELVLIAPHTPCAEVWRRRGGWVCEPASHTLRLDSIGVEIPLERLLAGLETVGS
jgi:Uma2 family endonuclease